MSQSTNHCGTYAGYMAHRTANTAPCDACKEAHRTYMANYRAANPDMVKHAKLVALARHRALVLLGQRYPAELAALIADERARLSGRSPRTSRKNGAAPAVLSHRPGPTSNSLPRQPGAR